MKKTIYITLISLLTVVAIIYGATVHIGGFAKNVYTPIANVFNLKSDNHSDWKKDNYARYNSASNLDEFSSIKFDIHIGSVTVTKGDSYKISYDSTRKFLIPEFSVNGRELKINQPNFSKKNNTGNNNCEIHITVPSDTELSFVKGKVKVGEIIITDISATELTLNLNVGEVSVQNSSFDKADLKTNIGEITVSGLKNLYDYSYDLSANIGNANIFGKSQKNYSQKGNNSEKKITASTNIGEIDIN